jgi:hypothetical protein
VKRPIDQFGALTYREHHRATRQQIGGSVRASQRFSGWSGDQLSVVPARRVRISIRFGWVQ